jgi:hypothetical protein
MNPPNDLNSAEGDGVIDSASSVDGIEEVAADGPHNSIDGEGIAVSAGSGE